MDDDTVPDLLPSSDTSGSDEDELPPLRSPTSSDGLPSLVEEDFDDEVGLESTAADPNGKAAAPAGERVSAPYSHPVSTKEEGVTAVNGKTAHSDVVSQAPASPKVTKPAVMDSAPVGDTSPVVKETPPAAAKTRSFVVAEDAFAKFKEKELENLQRLRKERGLADSESLSQMVVSRCHLRPGAPGSKLCEHDSSFFSLRCADRRIVIECTRGCRMLYHFPNCWRRVIKAYKEDVDPAWVGWSKGKEPQLVACITDGCGGFIKSAVVVEGVPGEEVWDTQYQLPKELADQLERQKLQDAEQANKAKLELLQKQQEEAKIQRRRRKAEAAAKRAAEAEAAGAAAKGRNSPAPAAAAPKGKAIEYKAAAQKPQQIIKIYNAGNATAAPAANAAKVAPAADSPWAPAAAAPAAKPAPAPAVQQPSPEASDPEFPSLSAAMQANGKPKAVAPKKKPKMVPLDPRNLGFAAAEEAPVQYEEYYEEMENSEDYANDRELQELDRKYPHYERDDYGNPLQHDDLYMGLDRLRLDPEMPVVSNHLLVEYLDIAKLVQVTNLNVDKYLKEKFSAWGGEIVHFRIFTRQEAAAISFHSVDQACTAWVRMEGKKLYRNYLNISFLYDFPNDVALKRVVPTYQPRNMRSQRIDKSICYVKYLPPNLLREMAEEEADVSAQELRNVLTHFYWRRVDDASEHGIPDPDALALKALDTFRPYVPPSQRSLPQQQPSPKQQQPPPPPVQRRETLESEMSYRSDVPVGGAEEGDVGGEEEEEEEEEELVGGEGGQVGSAAEAAPAQASSQQQPAAAAASPGFEHLFDVVQVLGCKSEHLQNLYRRYSAFKLEHRYFCDPHRIAAGPQERTALLLCNIDTGRLEGLWHATTNNGQEVDFRPVATVPALPFETYAPLLPPEMLQRAAANTPLKIPARLDGQHARQILAAFSRAAAAAGIGPPNPSSPTDAAPAAAPPAARPLAAAAPAAPGPHTIAAAAAAAAAKRPPALQPVVSPTNPSPATTPTPQVSPPTAPAPPVVPLLTTIPASTAAPPPAPVPMRPPMYNPIAPFQAPPAAPRPAPAATPAHIFPFFLGGGAPQAPTNAPPRPNVIQPLTVLTTAAPPVPITPLTTLPTYPAAARPILPYAPLPYLPQTVPTAPSYPPPAAAPPQPPPTTTTRSPSPSPAPSPSPGPSPAPPPHSTSPAPASATPSPTPAAPPKKVKNPCPLCGVKKALYLHVQCVKFGPCADCLPDKAQLAQVYPKCVHCKKPTCDADIVKIHR